MLETFQLMVILQKRRVGKASISVTCIIRRKQRPNRVYSFIYNHGMHNKFYGGFGCVIQTTRGAHVLSK